MIRNAGKFWFGEIVVASAESDKIVLFIPGSIEIILEEFYFDGDVEVEKIFSRLLRFLQRLEEKGSSLTSMRDAVKNFIERELMKAFLETL
jgi:hypothetical protein